MPLARFGAATLALLVAATATACGGAAHHPAQPQANAAQPAAAAPAVAGHQKASTVDTGTSDASVIARTGVGAVKPGSAIKPAHVPADRTEQLPADAPFVWSIKATVAPACVRAGSAARLTVHTAQNAGVAYLAIYAGNKSGAVPPWGDGYGGNSEGYSSKQDGTWYDTWTVRADAPRGPGHVTVVVASHQTTKQVDVPFTVVDPLTGTC